VGVSEPTPPQPPAPQAAPAPQRLRVAARRARAHAKIHLLHVRYVLGYLAAGFGVSAPVTLGYQVYYGQAAGEMFGLTGLSVLYGTLLLIPFFLLEPVTRVAWERMRVPEFRMFELTVSRWSMYASLALFVLSMLRIGAFAERMARWMPPGLFWTVFVLMGTAWAKIKAQVLIFPEFYADRGGDRILHVPPVDEDMPADQPAPIASERSSSEGTKK
jgi:hypothetical protein